MTPLSLTVAPNGEGSPSETRNLFDRGGFSATATFSGSVILVSLAEMDSGCAARRLKLGVRDLRNAWLEKRVLRLVRGRKVELHLIASMDALLLLRAFV